MIVVCMPLPILVAPDLLMLLVCFIIQPFPSYANLLCEMLYPPPGALDGYIVSPSRKEGKAGAPV